MNWLGGGKSCSALSVPLPSSFLPCCSPQTVCHPTPYRPQTGTRPSGHPQDLLLCSSLCSRPQALRGELCPSPAVRRCGTSPHPVVWRDELPPHHAAGSCLLCEGWSVR